MFNVLLHSVTTLMAYHRNKVSEEGDALKNFLPSAHKNECMWGHTQQLYRKDRSQLVLSDRLYYTCLWGGPPIRKIFRRWNRDKTLLITLLKKFRSLVWLNCFALRPSNSLKPSMFTQNQIPLRAKSAPHFKAKPNTKKLFIWNHSESSGMLLSRIHWRL